MANYQKRLQNLEDRLLAQTEDGFCARCAEKCESLHYNEPIPAPCPRCGKIAKVAVVIYHPDRGDQEMRAAIRGRIDNLIFMPDNFRDSRNS